MRPAPAITWHHHGTRDRGTGGGRFLRLSILRTWFIFGTKLNLYEIKWRFGRMILLSLVRDRCCVQCPEHPLSLSLSLSFLIRLRLWLQELRCRAEISRGKICRENDPFHFWKRRTNLVLTIPDRIAMSMGATANERPVLGELTNEKPTWAGQERSH